MDPSSLSPITRSQLDDIDSDDDQDVDAMIASVRTQLQALAPERNRDVDESPSAVSSARAGAAAPSSSHRDVPGVGVLSFDSDDSGDEDDEVLLALRTAELSLQHLDDFSQGDPLSTPLSGSGTGSGSGSGTGSRSGSARRGNVHGVQGHSSDEDLSFVESMIDSMRLDVESDGIRPDVENGDLAIGPGPAGGPAGDADGAGPPQRETIFRRKKRGKRSGGRKVRRRRSPGGGGGGGGSRLIGGPDDDDTMTPAERMYQKALEMEEELTELRDRYGDVSEEKRTLEAEINMKERVILQTTSRLEEAMMQLHKLKVEMDRKQQDLTTLRKENQTLAEVHSLNMMTRERLQRTSARAERPRKRKPLSVERLARITQLKDELKIKQNQVRSLETEIEACEEQIQRKDKGIEDMEAQIRQFQSREEKAYRIECRNAELQYQVDTLQKEISTLKQITRMKAQTIEQLNLQIQNWENLQEAFADLQRQSQTKQAEVNELLAKLNILRKENRGKESEIQKLVSQRDEFPVECLEDDKEYLRLQIGVSEDKRARLDATIRDQQKEIEMMQERLRQVQLALKDTNLERVVRRRATRRRRVDLEFDAAQSALNLSASLAAASPRPEFDVTKFMQRNLFLLIKKDAAVLARKKRALTTIFLERQSCIETLQAKIQMLEQEKVGSERSHKSKILGMKKKISQLKKEIGRSEGQYRRREKELRIVIAERKRQLRLPLVTTQSRRRRRANGKQ